MHKTLFNINSIYIIIKTNIINKMPKKKVTWEDFQNGKEYLMWGKLYDMAKSLDLTGPNFISSKESGSGVYWEPFLVLLFKFGNILKQTGKLKEIKMDWIRPLNYLESQSNEKVVYDGDNYIVEKAAIGNATNARLALQHLLDSINNYESLNEQNFQKEYKTLHSDSSYFFKQLNIFVKDGFRALHENIKLILKPLRMLRKSAYRLLSLERMEGNNEDLTVFESNKAMTHFVKGVHDFLESEDYKLKRDCDLTKLDDHLGLSMTREFYEYQFNDKLRKDEEENEGEEVVVKKKETSKGPMKTVKKQLSAEEELKLRIEKERKELTFININALKQQPPSRFVRQALQADFEKGLDATLQHLNKKVVHMFPFEIEAHKIFVNINCIPNWRNIPQIKFYLDQLTTAIEIMKIKLYEMKLNGLSRILIPISYNTEIVEMIKKVYDLHNIIDRILGDKLLNEQYLFIYDQIKMIINSSLKEELEVYKKQHFIEECVPKYILFMSMCHSASVLHKMIEHSRKDGGHFELDDYYQPHKHVLDSEDNLVINAYEIKDSLQQSLSQEFLLKNKTLWHEINTFGRLWLMEGYFPPNDREKWIEAITLLDSINILVQEDIRDMILLNNEDPSKNGENETSMNVTTRSEVERKKEKTATKKGQQRTQKHQKSSKGSGSIKSGKQRTVSRKNSIETQDSEGGLGNFPKKFDGLRPPIVWNFPVNKVIKLKNEMLIKEKKEVPKSEIRKANPFESYHDKRVETFINIFNELYKNFITYSKSKGNIWEYTYIKILNIFQIEYQYVTVTTIGTKKSEEDEQNQQQQPKEETKPPTVNVTKEDNSDNINISSNNDEL